MNKEETMKFIYAIDAVNATSCPLTDTVMIQTTGVPYFIRGGVVDKIFDGGPTHKDGISFTGSLDITVPQAKKLITQLIAAVKQIEDFNESIKEYNIKHDIKKGD